MADKETFSWIPKVLDVVTDFLALAKTTTEEEIEQLRKKLVRNLITYGMLGLALIFLLIGMIKHFTGVFWETEGIGFAVVGVIMIVLLAIYTITNK